MSNFKFIRYDEEENENLIEKKSEKVEKLDFKKEDEEENNKNDKNDVSVEDETLSILDIVILLSKYKKSIFIPVFLIIFSVISLMILARDYPSDHPLQLFPKIYRVKLEYILKDLSGSSSKSISSLLGNNSEGLGSLIGLVGNSGSGGIDSTLIEKIYTSNDFLDTLIKEFKIKEKLEKKTKEKDKDITKKSLRESILKNLTIVEDKNLGYTTVYFLDKDPKFAFDFLTRANELFFIKYNELSQVKSNLQLSFTEKRLDESMKELQLAIKALEDFQIKTGIYDIDNQKGMVANISSSMVSTISRLELKKSEVLSYMPSDSPQIIALNRQIYSAKLFLSKIQKSYSIGGIKLSYNDYLKYTPKYDELKRNLNLKVQIYTSLVVQYEQLKMKLKDDLPLIQLLNKPEMPDLNDTFKPKRKLILIVVSFASFFIFFFIAFLREFIFRVKNNPLNQKKLEEITSYFKKKKSRK